MDRQTDGWTDGRMAPLQTRGGAQLQPLVLRAGAADFAMSKRVVGAAEGVWERPFAPRSSQMCASVTVASAAAASRHRRRQCSSALKTYGAAPVGLPADRQMPPSARSASTAWTCAGARDVGGGTVLTNRHGIQKWERFGNTVSQNNESQPNNRLAHVKEIQSSITAHCQEGHRPLSKESCVLPCDAMHSHQAIKGPLLLLYDAMHSHNPVAVAPGHGGCSGMEPATPVTRKGFIAFSSGSWPDRQLRSPEKTSLPNLALHATGALLLIQKNPSNPNPTPRINQLISLLRF
jgi:hypothetical protein